MSSLSEIGDYYGRPSARKLDASAKCFQMGTGLRKVDEKADSIGSTAVKATQDQAPAATKPLTHIREPDLARVNKLSEKIEKALTTTVQGEFFEASKSSNAARDRQLPEVFALRAEIQDLKDALQKKEPTDQQDNEASKKQPGKPNTNMIATINNIVAERLAAEMRDVNIRMSRLEERAEKAERENKTLREKLETKEKKSLTKAGCTKDQFTALMYKVVQTEQQVAKLKEEDQNLKQKIDGTAGILIDDAASSKKQIYARITNVETKLNAKISRESVEQTKSHKEALELITDTVHQVDGLDEAIYELEDNQEDIHRRLCDLEQGSTGGRRNNRRGRR